MSWSSEKAPAHEGWVANVLADGRIGSGTNAQGVFIQSVDGTDEQVSWDQVVAWRVMCQCGWTGPSLPAATDPEYGYRDCPDDITDTVMLPAWEHHVAPYEAIDKLSTASAELAQLTRRVAELVDLARSGGVSWSEIGRATGLTRQGAQQRWG